MGRLADTLRDAPPGRKPTAVSAIDRLLADPNLDDDDRATLLEQLHDVDYPSSTIGEAIKAAGFLPDIKDCNQRVRDWRRSNLKANGQAG